MNGPGCVACRTHEAGTSHQHPEAFQTASEGGQRGQRGVCELAWYLGCPGGLVDKISGAVQIVDGNIGRRVVQWYCTRSFAARGILVQPRSRKPTLAVEEGSLLHISAHLCVGAFDAFKSKYDVQYCTPYEWRLDDCFLLLSVKIEPPRYPSRLIRPPSHQRAARGSFSSHRESATPHDRFCFSSCEERGRPGNSGSQATFTTPHTPHTPLKGIQTLKQALKHFKHSRLRARKPTHQFIMPSRAT